MKRALSLIMAILMVCTIFTGCNSGSDVPTQSGNTAGQGQSTNGTNADPYAEHMSFNVSSLAYTDKFDDDLYVDFSKKFNVDFTQNQCTFNDWVEKTRMWIYSGQMPDTAYWYFDWTTSYSEYVDFVSQGLLKPLPDDWKEKYPNLANMIKATGVEDAITIDGKLYMVPHATMVNFAPVTTAYKNTAIVYRKDWAEEFGFDFSDYEITLEELQSYVAACKEKYNAVGLDCAPDQVAELFVSIDNPGFYTFHKDENGKYVWGPGEESTLEGIKLLREMYENGTINKDYYLNENTTHYNSWATGKASCIFTDCVVNTYDLRIKGLQEQHPELNAEDSTGIAILIAPDGEWYGRTVANYFAANLFNPSLTDEEMDRLLRIMDWCCTEEGQIYASMGIEGVHYEKNADGELVSLLPVDENGIQVSILNYLPFSLVLGTYGIVSDDFGFVSSTNSEKSRVDVASVYKLKDSYAKAGDGNVSYWEPEYNFFTSDSTRNYIVNVEDKINELVVTPGIDVEAEWRAWVESSQAMVKPVLDDLNAAFGS